MNTLSPEARELLFTSARTANTFAPDPVDDSVLAEIHGLMKWGPTAMNSQPLRVLWVRSAEARERLLPHMSEGNRAKTSSAPVVAVLAVDVDFHDTLAKVFPHREGARDFFPEEGARVAWATPQAWLQVAYFIVAVRAVGLAAGPMTGFDAAGVDAELLADRRMKSICVVNVGKPGENAWMERLPRHSFDDVNVVL